MFFLLVLKINFKVAIYSKYTFSTMIFGLFIADTLWSETAKIICCFILCKYVNPRYRRLLTFFFFFLAIISTIMMETIALKSCERMSNWRDCKLRHSFLLLTNLTVNIDTVQLRSFSVYIRFFF